MNIFNNVSIGDGIIINNRVVIINNTEHPFLDNMKGNNVSVINNKPYIDGYELVNGRWKRTLKSMYHLWF